MGTVRRNRVYRLDDMCQPLLLRGTQRVVEPVRMREASPKGASFGGFCDLPLARRTLLLHSSQLAKYFRLLLVYYSGVHGTRAPCFVAL